MWVQHKDHCYAFNMSFYNYSVYGIEQAKGICQSMGGFLLDASRAMISSLPKQL